MGLPVFLSKRNGLVPEEMAGVCCTFSPDKRCFPVVGQGGDLWKIVKVTW